MTYLSEKLKASKSATITEWTQTNQQTIYNGDSIVFDVSRSSGTTGVSIDSSGNMTFATTKQYWLVMSVDCSRSDTNANFSFGFYDQSGVLLGASDGASESSWSVGITANNISSTCQAVIVDTSQTYSIRCTISSGTVTTNTPSLMVLEA